MRIEPLIAQVAEAIGEPIGAVRLRARLLREAKTIPGGTPGRGKGAELGADHAWMIALATLIPSPPKTAVSIVDALSRARLSQYCFHDVAFDVDRPGFSEKLPEPIASLGPNCGPFQMIAACAAEAACPRPRFDRITASLELAGGVATFTVFVGPSIPEDYRATFSNYIESGPRVALIRTLDFFTADQLNATARHYPEATQ